MRPRSLLVLTAGALALALSLAVTATGGTARTSAGATDTLRIPFLADMSVPDPDIFYDIEGNSVILSVYQGLVKYAPNSTKIVGDLARSWTVSPDELTYTFKLQPGVKFHDGSTMTSKAVKASLQRRLDVNQAPAYMLADVKAMQTPNPLTLRIVLKHRVGPFLSYLASSWGPKVIGPGAIVTHAGKDFGQTWLRTHGDGTGPYELTSFQRGTQYVLTRFPGHWGPKPAFKQVVIKIVPDIGTQRLMLEHGDLDAIFHSFPASELPSAAGDSQLRVLQQPSFLSALLYVNTNKAPFSSAAARTGLAQTVNLPQLVGSVYGAYGSVPKGPYPPGILPGMPPLDYGGKPSGKAPKGSGHILLAYTADDSGEQQRAAELLQAQIGSLGYSVTVKEVQLPQVYAYINNLKAAPDLLLMTNTPDAAHPDTWARIVWDSKGGLNFLGYKNAKIDALLDRALTATPAKAHSLYVEVGKLLVASHEILFVANVKDTMVVRRDLGGIDKAHVLAYPWMLDYSVLRRT
jgi:peptide/nickel transport system substrate-binding protein